MGLDVTVRQHRKPFDGEVGIVFRARLGAVNIVLGLAGLSHLPEQTLLRKTRQLLESRVSLSVADKHNDFIFAYLKDKSLVHDNLATRGRYEGFALIKQDDTWRAKDKRDNDLDTFPVFQMDVWMADPKVQSTVGVPTPKNVEEIVDFAFQLHLLSQGKGYLDIGGTSGSASSKRRVDTRPCAKLRKSIFTWR
jgi:hypothetical protein